MGSTQYSMKPSGVPFGNRLQAFYQRDIVEGSESRMAAMTSRLDPGSPPMSTTLTTGLPVFQVGTEIVDLSVLSDLLRTAKLRWSNMDLADKYFE